MSLVYSDVCVYDSPGALCEMGRCYQELKDFKNAELLYQESIKLSQSKYSDSRVYPYTEMSCFMFEHRNDNFASIVFFTKCMSLSLILPF
jgi:hypothetical protein